MKISSLLTPVLLGMCLAFGEATAQDKSTSSAATPASMADIRFEKELHDYGTIDQGANGVYEFKFSNSGKEPLIISGARGSCGCTVPSYPKEPIPPGGPGLLKVSYDTKRVGAFNKTVTVTSNANSGTKTLTIKGVVNAKAEEETFPAKKVSSGMPLENTK
ncbi:MAG: DUF1573 domain-containing protein [Bacteroidota bacterium]